MILWLLGYLVLFIARKMRAGAAAEQFRSLFDKADPVAYRYGTDRVHQSSRKTPDDRPAKGDVFYVMSKDDHVFKHGKSDARCKCDRHDAVAVVGKNDGIKQYWDRFYDLFCYGSDRS